MIKEFTARGEIYEIEIDEDTHRIYVGKAGKRVGTIDIDEREDGFSGEVYFYICHLALDACKGQGIGQACLEYHNEIYGGPLTAAMPNSGELLDGSHLTGDGVPFIARMRAKGIVAPVDSWRDE
ncbi:hypothetical protein [Pseudomonas sp. S2_F03]